jgi:hypothetical protein
VALVKLALLHLPQVHALLLLTLAQLPVLLAAAELLPV